MTTNIKIWSETHQTSKPVAKAIHRLAGGDPVEAERIWQYPTDQQLIEIWLWSTKSGKRDACKLIWNNQPLAEIMV